MRQRFCRVTHLTTLCIYSQISLVKPVERRNGYASIENTQFRNVLLSSLQRLARCLSRSRKHVPSRHSQKWEWCTFLTCDSPNSEQVTAKPNDGHSAISFRNLSGAISMVGPAVSGANWKLGLTPAMEDESSYLPNEKENVSALNGLDSRWNLPRILRPVHKVMGFVEPSGNYRGPLQSGFESRRVHSEHCGFPFVSHFVGQPTRAPLPSFQWRLSPTFLATGFFAFCCFFSF